MGALSMAILKDQVMNYNQGSEGLARWFLNSVHQSKEIRYVDDDVNRLHRGLLYELRPQDVDSMNSDYFIQAIYSANDFLAAYNDNNILYDLEEKLSRVRRLRTKKLL